MYCCFFRGDIGLDVAEYTSEKLLRYQKSTPYGIFDECISASIAHIIHILKSDLLFPMFSPPYLNTTMDSESVKTSKSVWLKIDSMLRISCLQHSFLLTFYIILVIWAIVLMGKAKDMKQVMHYLWIVQTLSVETPYLFTLAHLSNIGNTRFVWPFSNLNIILLSIWVR